MADIRIVRNGDHEVLNVRFDAEEQVDRFGNRFRMGRLGIAPVERVVVEEPVGAVLAKSVTHRSEEHTSELQSLMRISYAVFCLKKKHNTPHSNEIIPKNT